MATGLPIVAGDRGGYTDHLRDGFNSRVISRTDEAIERVMALASDPREGSRLGAAARRDAVALNADELPRRTVAVLTDQHSAADHETEAVTA
jgi:glycosyltransferase involved in cell wall biosynthesis